MVPLTSNTTRVFPFQVLVPAESSGLRVLSKGHAEQVRSIAVEGLGPALGRLPVQIMSRSTLPSACTSTYNGPSLDSGSQAPRGGDVVECNKHQGGPAHVDLGQLCGSLRRSGAGEPCVLPARRPARSKGLDAPRQQTETVTARSSMTRTRTCGWCSASLAPASIAQLTPASRSSTGYVKTDHTN